MNYPDGMVSLYLENESDEVVTEEEEVEEVLEQEEIPAHV